MLHPYTEMCIVFSFVKKKMGLQNNYLAYVCVQIWPTKQVHDFHGILMVTLCAGGHPTSLFLISNN